MFGFITANGSIYTDEDLELALDAKSKMGGTIIEHRETQKQLIEHLEYYVKKCEQSPKCNYMTDRFISTN